MNTHCAVLDVPVRRGTFVYFPIWWKNVGWEILTCILSNFTVAQAVFRGIGQLGNVVGRFYAY